MFPCGFGDQAWLIQTPGSYKETTTFINPSKASIEERRIPAMKGQLCLARFEEWLFLVDDLSGDCFLLNIYSSENITLPSIEEPFASLGTCILTSQQSSPDCYVIFVGREEHFLLFCRPCDEEWRNLLVEFDVTEVDNMLMYKGELYIILLNEIKIVDVASLSTDQVECDFIDKPEFFCYGNGRTYHLVESCGDLFLVETCFPGVAGTGSVNDLVISKLSDENSWVRVESIGDHAFFLDQHGGQSHCADDARVDRDCIYHVMSYYDGERLFKICLHDQTMSFTLLLGEAVQGKLNFYWILPMTTRKSILKPGTPITSSEPIECSEVCQKGFHLQEHESKDNNATLSYANLPLDIIQLISEKASLNDSGRLRIVCKQWAKLYDPIKEEPVWLMFCPTQHGTCQMYNPSLRKEFALNLKKLSFEEPTRLLFSKYGWVLALEGEYHLCLLNPFTGDYHRLPILEDEYSYNGIAFSSPPNSSSCVVFAIVGPPRDEFTSIISWHFGQEEWFEMDLDDDTPFHVAENNPVFADGEFYCLGKTGNLCVFNPDNNSWRVLDKPLPIHSEVPHADKEYCYLLECDGEMISVFQAINMDYVHVYKLDRSRMEWIRVEDLGDLTLFLDYRSSIARSLDRKNSRNKLYLPQLHDETEKEAFYYCMRSRMHHPKSKNLRRPYNCVWLEPSLNSNTTTKMTFSNISTATGRPQCCCFPLLATFSSYIGACVGCMLHFF